MANVWLDLKESPAWLGGVALGEYDENPCSSFWVLCCCGFRNLCAPLGSPVVEVWSEETFVMTTSLSSEEGWDCGWYVGPEVRGELANRGSVDATGM